MQHPPILEYFTYQHLPAHLHTFAAPFCEVAIQIAATLPESHERTKSLDKLLEAKDCAVRAGLTQHGKGFSTAMSAVASRRGDVAVGATVHEDPAPADATGSLFGRAIAEDINEDRGRALAGAAMGGGA